MNKFYGGGDQVVDMTCSAPVTKSWDPATAVTQAGRSSALPASTYQGPSREGVSGERAAPNPSTARPFDEHEYAEQMRRGFAMKYGSPHAAERKA